MNLQRVREVIFPYGNFWFYILALIWILSTAIFYITIPAMLYATSDKWEQIYGIALDPYNPLVQLSGTLYYAAFNLTRIFILYLIAAAVFDAIEQNRIMQRKRGYL